MREPGALGTPAFRAGKFKEGFSAPSQSPYCRSGWNGLEWSLRTDVLGDDSYEPRAEPSREETKRIPIQRIR